MLYKPQTPNQGILGTLRLVRVIDHACMKRVIRYLRLNESIQIAGVAINGTLAASTYNFGANNISHFPIEKSQTIRMLVDLKMSILSPIF